MSNINFGINNQLWNSLNKNNEGKYLLEDVELTRSEILQRIITIKIGLLFSKLPFYLSIHADWRGRVYTQSFLEIINLIIYLVLYLIFGKGKY